MENKITVKNISDLQVTMQDCIELVPEKQNPNIYLKLVKAHLMKPDKSGKERDVTDFMLFLYTAKRLGLDPLARQLYPVFRFDTRQGREVMSIQTGIDGYRAVAQRTGEYLGSDDAVFEEKGNLPTKATVTVYKLNKVTGDKVAITASARWSEYSQKNNPIWGNMPFNQLAKCAEALALRKAFPADLSGVYVEEEMHQADVILPPAKKELAKVEIEPAPQVTDLVNKQK